MTGPDANQKIVVHRGDPRVAPPKLWDPSKPPGGKLPEIPKKPKEAAASDKEG